MSTKQLSVTYNFDALDIALGLDPQGIVVEETFEATYMKSFPGMKGQKHSEETKKKMSETAKGRDMSKAVAASAKTRVGKPAVNRGWEYPENRRKGKLIKDGVVYEVDGVMRFAKEHNASYHRISCVLRGKMKSHKGFRLWEGQ